MGTATVVQSGFVLSCLQSETSPHLGHLSLDPAGLQGRHSFLCCRWTVKVHKAVACKRNDACVVTRILKEENSGCHSWGTWSKSWKLGVAAWTQQNDFLVCNKLISQANTDRYILCFHRTAISDTGYLMWAYFIYFVLQFACFKAKHSSPSSPVCFLWLTSSRSAVASSRGQMSGK